MSFDLNLSTVCDHRVYREPATLDLDRRSLRVSRPIISNVEVFASNDKVPSSDYILKIDPLQNVTQSRLVYFNEKWVSTEDYFEVSYNTFETFCSKCSGLDILDDVSYNIQGDFLTIRNENLLLQNMEKFTITELMSNPFHSFIGTNLVLLLGQKYSDANYMTTKITQEINSTMNVFKDLQSQYTLTGRVVTKGELLDSISNISVTTDKQDPTILRAAISGYAKSGKPAQFVQLLRRVA